MRRLLPPLVAALAVALLWEDLARLFEVPAYLLPTPSGVLRAVGERLPDGRLMIAFLASATAKTAGAALVGFVASALFGVLFGTALASSRLLRVGVYPLANLLQMVPVVALAPLLNIWFGYGLKGVAAAACVVSIFPVIANTVDGLRSTDPQLVELFAVYRATRAQRWWRLELPSALPQIFTGLRVAAGLSVIGAVVGELVSGVLDEPPIGAVIATNLRTGRLEIVFAAIAGSALVGFGLFGLVSWVSTLALGTWHDSARRQSVDAVALTPERRHAEHRALAIGGLVLVALTAFVGLRSPRSHPAEKEPASPTLAKGGPERLTLQLNWMPEPEFGGLYAAAHYGFDKEEGLALELVSGGPGVPSAQLVASGKVDFGVLDADQLLAMRAQGGELVALYASFQVNPRAIVAHEADAPESLEALWHSKRTVALEAGAGFSRWLNLRYGEGDVHLVASQGGLAQFRQDPKLAQAVFVFAEPVTLAAEGIATRLYRVAESGWNPYAVVVAGRESDVQARPARAAALSRALQRGWARYLRDPAEVNRALAKLNPSMSFESMQRAAEVAAPYVRGDAPALGDEELGKMTEARFRELGEQMHRLGLISAAPADANSVFVGR